MQYLPGERNLEADAMSRYGMSEDGKEKDNLYSTSTMKGDDFKNYEITRYFLDMFCSIEEIQQQKIKREQRKDEMLKKIIDLVEKKEMDIKTWNKKNQYRIYKSETSLRNSQ